MQPLQIRGTVVEFSVPKQLLDWILLAFYIIMASVGQGAKWGSFPSITQKRDKGQLWDPIRPPVTGTKVK